VNRLLSLYDTWKRWVIVQETWTFTTALTPEECRAKLSTRMLGPFDVLRKRPLATDGIGRVGLDQFWLRENNWRMNGHLTAWGRFDVATSHTIVTVNIGLNPYLPLFLLASAVFVGFCELLAVVLALARYSEYPPIGLALPILFVLLPAMLGRWQGLAASDNRRWLRAFLLSTLEGHEP
jgi:hypothetical protein